MNDPIREELAREIERLNEIQQTHTIKFGSDYWECIWCGRKDELLMLEPCSLGKEPKQ